MVFDVYLSAQAAFRLELPFAARQEIAHNPHLRVASYFKCECKKKKMNYS
jgi:hypothetical protein